MKNLKAWYAEEDKRDDEVLDILRRVDRGDPALGPSDVKRALAKDKKRTKMVRATHFGDNIALLIHSATTSKLYPGDRTQPSLEDIVYLAVREAVWRLAERVGASRATEIGEAAFEAAQFEFSDD